VRPRQKTKLHRVPPKKFFLLSLYLSSFSFPSRPASRLAAGWEKDKEERERYGTEPDDTEAGPPE
jgi:hypothetical protein